MARALIVGCGCRGQELGRRLMAVGWEVRGTSRREAGLATIAAAGIEAAFADPSRPHTVLDLLGDVTVLVWLLGSARGTDDELAAIHGAPLDRLVEKLVETPVRGLVYEAAGSVEQVVLERAREALEAASDRWQIPLSATLVDPDDHATWPDPFGMWAETNANAVIRIASPDG